jgi:hypothetical protein
LFRDMIHPTCMKCRAQVQALSRSSFNPHTGWITTAQTVQGLNPDREAFLLSQTET